MCRLENVGYQYIALSRCRLYLYVLSTVLSFMLIRARYETYSMYIKYSERIRPIFRTHRCARVNKMKCTVELYFWQHCCPIGLHIRYVDTIPDSLRITRRKFNARASTRSICGPIFGPKPPGYPELVAERWKSLRDMRLLEQGQDFGVRRPLLFSGKHRLRRHDRFKISLSILRPQRGNMIAWISSYSLSCSRVDTIAPSPILPPALACGYDPPDQISSFSISKDRTERIRSPLSCSALRPDKISQDLVSLPPWTRSRLPRSQRTRSCPSMRSKRIRLRLSTGGEFDYLSTTATIKKTYTATNGSMMASHFSSLLIAGSGPSSPGGQGDWPGMRPQGGRRCSCRQSGEPTARDRVEGLGTFDYLCRFGPAGTSSVSRRLRPRRQAGGFVPRPFRLGFGTRLYGNKAVAQIPGQICFGNRGVRTLYSGLTHFCNFLDVLANRQATFCKVQLEPIFGLRTLGVFSNRQHNAVRRLNFCHAVLAGPFLGSLAGNLGFYGGFLLHCNRSGHNRGSLNGCLHGCNLRRAHFVLLNHSSTFLAPWGYLWGGAPLLPTHAKHYTWCPARCKANFIALFGLFL